MIHVQGAVFAFLLLFLASTASAMKGTDHSSHKMSEHKMEHGSSSHDHANTAGPFKYADTADGLHATFQVMSLASMKMKDPDGKTHHIMASFSKNDRKMKKITGNVEVISPSGKKQTGKLIHFGGGMYAANFTFDEAGKWAVVCQFTDQGMDYTKKFSYPHQNN